MKQLLYLKDEQLKEFIEKIFITYRETFSDTKKILDNYKIGVAHQKVLHLISQYHGITISELLKKLKVVIMLFFQAMLECPLFLILGISL